jgi:hypothetical protein
MLQYNVFDFTDTVFSQAPRPREYFPNWIFAKNLNQRLGYTPLTWFNWFSVFVFFFIKFFAWSVF